MPESITQPRFNRESLESPTGGEDNSRMSEDTTRGLPQDGVERILARLTAFEDKVENRFSNVENRLFTLEEKVDALEDKVDRRLQETRPIWEQVLVRLDGVETRLDGFEAKQNGFETKLDGFEKRLDDFGSELRTSLRRFERQVGELNGRFGRTRCSTRLGETYG